jgi:hypothetical protein
VPQEHLKPITGIRKHVRLTRLCNIVDDYGIIVLQRRGEKKGLNT